MFGWFWKRSCHCCCIQKLGAPWTQQGPMWITLLECKGPWKRLPSCWLPLQHSGSWKGQHAEEWCGREVGKSFGELNWGKNAEDGDVEERDGWIEQFCLTRFWLGGAILDVALAFCSVFSFVSSAESATELAGSLGAEALMLWGTPPLLSGRRLMEASVRAMGLEPFTWKERWEKSLQFNLQLHLRDVQQKKYYFLFSLLQQQI